MQFNTGNGLSGVIALTYEFILSCLIVAGGGFMIYHNSQVALASSIIGVVVTFWFTNNKLRRDSGTQSGTSTTDPTQASQGPAPNSGNQNQNKPLV